jgi:ABC-type phosphate transport system substrate-binding protein
MTAMRVNWMLAAMAFAVFLPHGARAADFPDDILVIANNSAPVSKLSVAEVQEIFLKNRVYWTGTTKVVAINAQEGSKLRDEFRKRVLQMTSNAEKQYWQTRKIKTGVTEPAQFSDSLKAVFKIAGSIGYIYRSQLKPGMVKVLLALPVQP